MAQRCSSIISHDGERVQIGDWVLTESPHHVARVEEILQIAGSSASHRGHADMVLLERYQVAEVSPVYSLPCLRRFDYAAVDPQVWTIISLIVS